MIKITYNPISKSEERDKEKKQSEYMKEMKAKYSKKYEDVFSIIQQIQNKKEKVIKEEYKSFCDYRKKSIAIGWFPLSWEKIKSFYLPCDVGEYTEEGENEIYDFMENVMEDILKKYQSIQKEFWKDHKEFKKEVKK